MTHDTGSSRKVVVLTGLMMLFGGAEISSAATIVQSKSFGPLSGLVDTTTLTYDQFNPSNGTLSSVTVSLASQIAEPVANWTIEFEVTLNNALLSVSTFGVGNTTVSYLSGPLSGSALIAAYTGVGDFPVLFTYGALCGFVGGPTCGLGWSGNLDITYNFTPSALAEVPTPAALPLFATGLGALGLLTWRRKRKALAA